MEEIVGFLYMDSSWKEKNQGDYARHLYEMAKAIWLDR